MRFSGRSTRTEVWTYYIVGNALASLIAAGLAVLTGEAGGFGPTLAHSLAVLAYCAPMPALMARRLHDIGRSGWFAAPLVPVMIVASMTESGQPNLLWVDKTLSGWLPTLLVAAGTLFYLAISLLPPREEGEAFAPDRRPSAR